jgi:hypothetical protein
MNIKFTLLAIAGFLALVVGVTGLTQNRQRIQPERGEGLLKRSAARAKAEGRSEVIVRAPLYRPAGVTSLDQALSYYTAVIATPVDSKSYMQSPDKIVTWYKFKVIEYLNRKKPRVCSTCPSTPSDIPAEMLPLQEDEVLIPRPSGSVVVDDVKVTSVESGFPPFLQSKNYLLFVQLDSSSRVGVLRIGAYGVFTVDENGDIKHINQKNHPFKHEIENADGNGNAVEQLRAKIRNFRSSQAATSNQ